MAWCHQATSHYLSQCWLRSMSSYGVTRPQWFNKNPQFLKFRYIFFFRSVRCEMPPPTTLTHRGASPDSCPANGNSCDFGMEEITDQITPGSDCQKRPWETLVIIEFSNKIPPETVRWITSKITSLRKNGGGEMLATTVLDDDGEVGVNHHAWETHMWVIKLSHHLLT